MQNEFKDKKILIIGCSRGLGRSLAERFIAEGAQLYLFDINPVPELAKGKVECVSYKSFVADVSDVDEFVRTLNKVLVDVGQIDGLVYVVRDRIKKDMMDISPGDFDRMIALTLKALYFATLACIPYLKMSDTPFIVAFSSVSAEFIGDESGPYHIAKAGLEQLVKYFAVRLGEYGIRVNAVRPGMIVQDEHKKRFYSEDNASYRKMAEGAQPIKKVGDSSDVVDSVIYFASKNAKFVTGQILTLDGGLTLQDQFALSHNVKMALRT